MKRSEVKRGTKEWKRRKPMPRPKTPTVDAKIRRQVRERSRGICEAGTPDCTYTATRQHHTKGRGPYLNNASLMLDVCDPCHRFIHAHPAESYEHGWMVKRNA